MKDLVDGISPGSSLTGRASDCEPGAPMLQLEALQCSFTGPLTTTVHANEIIGLFGLLGSGRTNLLESLAGVRRPVGGGGVSLSRTSPCLHSVQGTEQAFPWWLPIEKNSLFSAA